MPTHPATSGYRVAGEKTKRVYEIHEECRAAVRRIIQMVGVDGFGNRAAAKTLNEEGVPSPPG